MKLIVQNSSIEYQVEGANAGSSVLILHGWGRDLHDFDSLSQTLTPDYKVIRVDLPGFGKSEMIKGVSVMDYAAFVKDFLNKIGETPIAYIGHSFGGRILLKGVGLNILPQPNKLVLIASAGVRTFGLAKFILNIVAKIGNIILKVPPFNLLKSTVQKIWIRSLRADYHTSGRMKEVFKAAVSEDLRAHAATIQTPTLLIWGKNDIVTPLIEAEILHSLIKKSNLKIFEYAGHFVFAEKQDEVNSLIKSYISNSS